MADGSMLVPVGATLYMLGGWAVLEGDAVDADKYVELGPSGDQS